MSLPAYASDMLAARIRAIDGAGTFTLQDSQPCRLLRGVCKRPPYLCMDSETLQPRLREPRNIGGAGYPCKNFIPPSIADILNVFMHLPDLRICANLNEISRTYGTPGGFAQ